jgi:hypothetical protein
MELKDIVDVGETGRSNKLWVKKSGDGHTEQFSMRGRDEFLDEVKFALRDGLGTAESIPSSLVVAEDLEVPKYSIPAKYLGVVVRLRTTYLTPKICCMCGEPAPDKTITAKSIARQRLLEGWGPRGAAANVRSSFTYPFPICDGCNRVHRRAKVAASLGGITGGAVFVLLFISGIFAAVLPVLAAIASALLGLGQLTGMLFPLFIIAAIFVAFGWVMGGALAVSYALRGFPKERHAFLRVVAEDKGIRVTRRPGFVTFGFISKEFATVFHQMNGGAATVVDTSP